MSHLELCSCGHEVDHRDKPCGHEDPSGASASCPCPSGIRVDLATFQLLVDQTQLANHRNQMLAEQCQTQARILAILEQATGLQSRLVDAGNGRAKVEVKPKIVVVR